MAMQHLQVPEQKPADQQQQQQQKQQLQRQHKPRPKPKRVLCNEFLLQRKRMLPVLERKKRRQQFYYGTLDQADEIDGGMFRLLFSVVSGPWLHDQDDWAQRARESGPENSRFLATVPIFLVQIDLDASEIFALTQLRGSRIGTAADEPPTVSVSKALVSLERRWVRIEAASGGGRGALVFHNLFEPAARIRVESIRTPSLGIRQILNDLDALRNQRDATLDEIEYQLSTSDEIEYVAVYDVGQGEAIGLVHKDKVACYFDFGGGAAGNQKTFPNRVKKFCFCNKPPIVLSHWDHDHWSSQGRDKRAHLSTWIVPRQSLKSSKRGLHHSALIRAIVESGGRIMIWPSDVSRHTFGQIVVNQCTGSSKNSSGLALEVLPPSKLDGKPILLPADAGYGDLPNYPADGAYDAVVCPHHGGASNSPTAPKPPAAAYQRLVYSYGKENTYGHPLRRTRRMHHNSLWSDAKVIKRLQPQITRNTADRTKIGVGHVGFEWTATKLPGPLVCDRKKSLQVQQK